MLTTRFLLDLQAASRQDVKLDSDDPLHLSKSFGSLSLQDRFIGSIGENILGDAIPTDEDLHVDREDGNHHMHGSEQVDTRSGGTIHICEQA